MKPQSVHHRADWARAVVTWTVSGLNIGKLLPCQTYSTRLQLARQMVYGTNKQKDCYYFALLLFCTRIRCEETCVFPQFLSKKKSLKSTTDAKSGLSKCDSVLPPRAWLLHERGKSKAGFTRYYTVRKNTDENLNVTPFTR